MARPQNVYGCRFCSTRLWVSTEALKDRSAPVGIVCFNCKYAETYSLDSNSRFYDSTAYYGRSDTDFGMFISTLVCEDTGCTTPLPVFFSRHIPTDKEEKRQEVSTWNWDRLKCPSGHSIPKPASTDST